jgi:hypothetical protein
MDLVNECYHSGCMLVDEAMIGDSGGVGSNSSGEKDSSNNDNDNFMYPHMYPYYVNVYITIYAARSTPSYSCVGRLTALQHSSKSLANLSLQLRVVVYTCKWRSCLRNRCLLLLWRRRLLLLLLTLQK